MHNLYHAPPEMTRTALVNCPNLRPFILRIRERLVPLWNRGDEVPVYYYRDRLEDFVGKRPDIFKEVK